MSRAWEVFRFEIGYQVRRASTRVYLAIFLGLAAAVGVAILADARHDGYFFNAPVVIGLITIVTTMFALLVAAGVAADAATRDAQTRIQPLLFTTPLGEAAYLGGRFAGAFAILALLLLAVPLALLAATRFVEPQVLGPFRLEAYLTSYFVIAVPNAFIATAVLYALAMLTRRALAAYAGAVVMFFSVFVAEEYVGARLGKWGLAKLADPLGWTAVHATWTSFNAAQKSAELVPVAGGLLVNRVLWVGVALAILLIAALRFRFMECGGNASAFQPHADRPANWKAEALPPHSIHFDWRTRLHQLRAITFDALRDLHTSRAWWIVPLVAILFIATAAEVLEVEMGTPGPVTSARVADIFAAGEMARLVAILIALSARELIWRERDARIDAIIGVTPVPRWVSVLGRYLAMAMMLAITELIFMVSGMAVQAMLGSFRFDLGIYLAILGFQLAGYLLFAALAIAVHTVVNQKYVGNVIAVLLYIAIQMAPELGVEHNLLIFGGAPVPAYSEISGFGGGVGPWLLFTLYWTGWALAFKWGQTPMKAIAIAFILGAGGFVFWNTNVLNRYRTDAEIEQRSVEYKQRYGKYATLAQPMLAATKLRVDFDPEERGATIRGTYRLENRTAEVIREIHVVVHADVETSGVAFDRPSRPTLRDDNLGYRIYALATPLQPRESLRMEFVVKFAQRGFRNYGWNPAVTANGSWFQHRGEQSHGSRQWLPFVGYQTSREPRPGVPRLEDVAARSDQRGREKIEFEAVVGTSSDQVGVAPGVLRRTWSEGGRRYFQYVADAPITNTWAIYSARYAVRRARWRDVQIEILHHPTHTANLERMLKSVTASLEYNTRNYGPYPHRVLRLVEYPSTGHSMGLTSYPGMIEYSEAFALSRPEDDPREIDFPFAVMAHEMGHQWWGHQVLPAGVEGAPLLSESLAWYSAMMVVEETYGREHLLRILDIMRSQYLAPHETRDVPLLRAWDRLDAYRTGPFAMYALRESVGEERVNLALRRLVAKFDPSRPPLPTSLDLYAELRAVAPAALLKDLFEDITYWDLRTRSVDVVPDGGAFRVTLHVEAQKLKGDAAGKERAVPMNDPIVVALFDADGKAIYRAPHPIRSGAQTITIVVPRPPARAGVDPDHVLLDRTPADNFAVNGV